MKKKKFQVDTSQSYIIDIIKNKIEKIYNQTILNLLYFNKAKKIPWNFLEMRELIRNTIPIGIYSYYHEDTSSAGNSTFHSIEAFEKYHIIPNYLSCNKSFSKNLIIKLFSKKLGNTIFKIKNPFFTVPYACASVYGGSSDEIACLRGTINGGGIYTIVSYSTYTIEEYFPYLKNEDFYMFQIYLTIDNDINISIIERAKSINVSVILLTIDNPIHHQGYGLIENGGDWTYESKCLYNLLNDPVFNIKCFKKYNCVGCTTKDCIQKVAYYLNFTCFELKKYYNLAKAFEFGREIQFTGGMSKVNNLQNPNDPNYIFSIKNIAFICHSNKSLCRFFHYPFKNGVPMVVKGCISSKLAFDAYNLDADGIYVSIHGGRFLYDAVAPIDVIKDIVCAIKKENENFGIWFDGGIRNGHNILKAFANGAEFVGLGRPIIYSCVLFGSSGVQHVYEQYSYELEQSCKIAGIESLNDRKKLNHLIKCRPQNYH